MNVVDEYINQLEGIKKEWIVAFTNFMRTNHPDLPETISYKMPLYKINDTYLAFSPAKNYFSFHALDFESIEELKTLLPKAAFGKGCAKIKYTNKDAWPILFDMCNKIIAKHLQSR